MFDHVEVVHKAHLRGTSIIQYPQSTVCFFGEGYEVSWNGQNFASSEVCQLRNKLGFR